VPEPEPKSLPEVATDLWGLTRDYARQETVDPIKGVGRYLGYGGGGALLGSIGVILLMLALLRALQTETGTTFQGNWSWAPYMIVLVVAGAVAAYALSRISRASGKSNR
jgi:Putative Actinobacterial Holin-X, holin superfamily III